MLGNFFAREKLFPFIDLKCVKSVGVDIADGSLVAQHEAGEIEMFSARSVISGDDHHCEDFVSVCDTEIPSANPMQISQSDREDSGSSSSLHLSKQSGSFFRMLSEQISDSTTSSSKICSLEIGSLSHNSDQIETDVANTIEAMATVNLGSIEHGQRKCKHCLWNMKPSGCRQGLQCKFCHLCSKDQYMLKMRNFRTRRACRVSEAQSLKILSEVSKVAQPEDCIASKAAIATVAFKPGSMLAVPEDRAAGNTNFRCLFAFSPRDCTYNK